MCLICGKVGILTIRITTLVSIQIRTLLKERKKKTNVNNYIKYKLRPSWQTRAYVYTICNEPETSTNSPILYQTVLNDPRRLLWKQTLFASCWKEENSIYSQQADFFPKKERVEPSSVSLFSLDLLCQAWNVGGDSPGGTERSQGFCTSRYLSLKKKTSGVSQKCSSPFPQNLVLVF